MINYVIYDLNEYEKPEAIKLSAQVGAKDFWQKMGFVGQGDLYMDAGIEHTDMTLHSKEKQS